jgi:prepilin peptidase CpaA
MGPGEIGMHVAAAAAVLVVAFVFFTRGWVGGGDAKLAAAISLWFGFDHLLQYLLDAALLGGGLTLLLINFRMVALPPSFERWAWVARLHEKKGGVPYGIALAAAALLVYPDTIWMKPLGG